MTNEDDKWIRLKILKSTEVHLDNGDVEYNLILDNPDQIDLPDEIPVNSVEFEY